MIRQMFLNNLRVVSPINDPAFANALRIGVRDDWPQLRDLLNKAIDAVSETEVADLRSRWFDEDLTTDNRIRLTGEESAFLAEHSRLTLGIDRAWPPFEFVDENGRYSGISAGFAKAVEERPRHPVDAGEGQSLATGLGRRARGEHRHHPDDRKDAGARKVPYLHQALCLVPRRHRDPKRFTLYRQHHGTRGQAGSAWSMPTSSTNGSRPTIRSSISSRAIPSPPCCNSFQRANWTRRSSIWRRRPTPSSACGSPI